MSTLDSIGIVLLLVIGLSWLMLNIRDVIAQVVTILVVIGLSLATLVWGFLYVIAMIFSHPWRQIGRRRAKQPYVRRLK